MTSVLLPCFDIYVLKCVVKLRFECQYDIYCDYLLCKIFCFYVNYCIL